MHPYLIMLLLICIGALQSCKSNSQHSAVEGFSMEKVTLQATAPNKSTLTVSDGELTYQLDDIKLKVSYQRYFLHEPVNGFTFTGDWPQVFVQDRLSSLTISMCLDGVIKNLKEFPQPEVVPVQKAMSALHDTYNDILTEMAPSNQDVQETALNKAALDLVHSVNVGWEGGFWAIRSNPGAATSAKAAADSAADAASNSADQPGEASTSDGSSDVPTDGGKKAARGR